MNKKYLVLLLTTFFGGLFAAGGANNGQKAMENTLRSYHKDFNEVLSKEGDDFLLGIYGAIRELPEGFEGAEDVYDAYGSPKGALSYLEKAGDEGLASSKKIKSLKEEAELEEGIREAKTGKLLSGIRVFKRQVKGELEKIEKHSPELRDEEILESMKSRFSEDEYRKWIQRAVDNIEKALKGL